MLREFPHVCLITLTESSLTDGPRKGQRQWPSGPVGALNNHNTNRHRRDLPYVDVIVSVKLQGREAYKKE